MIIPVSIRFKGTYDIVLRDTITGKIKDKRKNRQFAVEWI